MVPTEQVVSSFSVSQQKTLLPREAYERALFLLKGEGKCLLGIAGSPGVGKSTFAAQLVSTLGRKAVIVPMDGFHLSNAMLAELGRSLRKGASDTFDVDGFIAILKRIKAQRTGPVYAPEFRRSIEEAVAGAICIDPETSLVVVEGNYLLCDGPWASVRSLFDET